MAANHKKATSFTSDGFRHDTFSKQQDRHGQLNRQKKGTTSKEAVPWQYTVGFTCEA
jgi:hypothetical protein